jgi:hypothetical protein
MSEETVKTVILLIMVVAVMYTLYKLTKKLPKFLGVPIQITTVVGMVGIAILAIYMPEKVVALNSFLQTYKP